MEPLTESKTVIEAEVKCIVERKFLFWKWKEVQHSFKLYSVEKFMWCSTSFIVHRKCEICGRIKKESFVENDQLILEGVPQEILNDVGTCTYYFKN